MHYIFMHYLSITFKLGKFVLQELLGKFAQSTFLRHRVPLWVGVRDKYCLRFFEGSAQVVHEEVLPPIFWFDEQALVVSIVVCPHDWALARAICQNIGSSQLAYIYHLPYNSVSKEISKNVSFYKISPIFWTFLCHQAFKPIFST